MEVKKSIVSEQGHYYIDLRVGQSQIWENFVSYLHTQLKYPTSDQTEEILINEFNAKWLRSEKRNIIKFYSASDLEFFVLRFS